MNRDELADYLEGIGAAIPAPVGRPEIVVGALIAKGLLKLGAALVRRGLDPVEHITRLLDADPLFAAADKEVDAAAGRKFSGEFGTVEPNPYDGPPPPPPDFGTGGEGDGTP